MFAGYGKPAVAGGNISAGLWQTFENATLSAANLATTDNNASAVWDTTGAAGFTITGSGERATRSTVNSTADTGTLGLVRDNNTGAGKIQVDLNTYPTTQSVGFWFHVTTLSADTALHLWGCGESASGANAICEVKFTDTSGTRTVALFGATTSSNITVSIATWYWCTVKVVNNSTCSLAVYDTAGVQVGSTVTCTGKNFNFFYHGIQGITSSGTGSTYWDDLVIDYSTAAFPLGP